MKMGKSTDYILCLEMQEKKSRVMYVGHENNGFDISPEGAGVLKNVLDNQ